MKAVCKKLFSLVLVAILLVSAVPFQALADGVTYYDVNVTVNDASGSQTLTVKVADGDNLIVNAANLASWGYANSNPTGYTVTCANGTSEQWYGINASSYNQAIAVTVTNNPTSFSLTLNPKGVSNEYAAATVNGNISETKTVEYGKSMGVLPNAVLAGHTFAGWYTADGTKIESTNAICNFTANTTLYARFTLDTNNLELKYIINGNVNDAHSITKYAVPTGNYVWKWLEANAKTDVNNALPAGYGWEGFWYSDRNTQLTQQNDTTNVPEVIFVNFIAKTYTLSFNPNGGTVSTSSKTVTFDKAVGDLPTPTRSGYIFLGWNTKADGTGTTYTKDTVYKVAGDTTLYAQWAAEASVLLKIYLNGDTKTAHIIYDMKGYIKDNAITKADVETVVKKYYKAANSSGLKLDGLFTSDNWSAYVADSSYKGQNTVTITDSGKTTYVYVMVNNATLGESSSTNPTTKPTTSTNPTTKPSDTTNPQTGDNSMVYTAMTVMLIAAAAVAVLYLGRKKKQF